MNNDKFTNHPQTGRVAWLQRPGALAPACRQAGRLALGTELSSPATKLARLRIACVAG